MAKKFKMTIDTGNAAFDGCVPQEVARILREVASRLDERACLPDCIRLFDLNGNHVGEAKLGGR